MLRWFLADLRTGRQILDLPVLSGNWRRMLNRAEEISCTVDLRDPDVLALHVRNTTAPAKTVLGVSSGDVVLAAGPIWMRQYNHDAATLEVTAKGLWSYYDHRLILPLLAQSISLSEFTVPDPENDGGTIPNPELRTSYSGLELGTIAKRLVQQAHFWTGGSVPVVFEADRSGAHERNYEGAEFESVGDVLDQLQEVEGGPDIRFLPRFTSDNLAVEWVLQTGTQAVPELASSVTHRWDVTAEDSPVSDFRIEEDGSLLTSNAWVSGGRSQDDVLVARAASSRLIELGYPILERLDASRTTVEYQSTMDAYARGLLADGSAPTEVWSFSVEANVQPLLASYWEGDYAELDFRPYGSSVYTVYDQAPVGDGLYSSDGLPVVEPGFFNPADLTEDPNNPGFYLNGQEVRSKVAGDPYIVEGGTFRQRIIAIAGDAAGEVVQVQCAPGRSS